MPGRGQTGKRTLGRRKRARTEPKAIAADTINDSHCRDTQNPEDPSFESESEGISGDESSSDSEEEPPPPEPYTPGDVVWEEAPRPMKRLLFGETCGLRCQPSGGETSDFFDFLVTDVFYEHVVLRTNVLARNESSQWEDLTREELRTFIGLLFHMGTIRLGRLQDYWKTHRLFNFSTFSRHMSRGRFLAILRSLYPTRSNGTGADGVREQAGVHWLLEYFNSRMDEVYYPEKSLLVDEVTGSWGRRKRKRARLLSVLAESNGLTLRVWMHSSDSSGRCSPEVVLSLLEGKLDKGHSIYSDCLFTGVELARDLLLRDTYCTGLLDRDSREAEFLAPGRPRKGELVRKFAENVVLGKWEDVVFLSTEFSGDLTLSSGRRGRQRWRPNALVCYDGLMSGLSHKNEALGQNSPEIRSLQSRGNWSRKVAIYLLEVLLLNSYCLYIRYAEKKLSWYKFRLEVIDDLLFRNVQGKDSRGRVKIRVGEAPGPLHLPYRLEKRKRCRYCYQNGVRKDTSYYCSRCEDAPGLCLNPCFEMYHMESARRVDRNAQESGVH